jgi:mycothiol system anti-sigma-R factor
MSNEAPITCAEAVDKLWQYLDGAVSADDHGRIDAHLSFCRSCCGEMEFARELQTFLRDADRSELPDDVRARLEGFVEEL